MGGDFAVLLKDVIAIRIIMNCFCVDYLICARI
jgi:hypothetical protein